MQVNIQTDDSWEMQAQSQWMRNDAIVNSEQKQKHHDIMLLLLLAVNNCVVSHPFILHLRFLTNLWSAMWSWTCNNALNYLFSFCCSLRHVQSVSYLCRHCLIEMQVNLQTSLLSILACVLWTCYYYCVCWAAAVMPTHWHTAHLVLLILHTVMQYFVLKLVKL